MRGHQEHSLFRSGTNGMGTDRGGREVRGLGAFYRLGREYITMQGLLIETRNDLPATFHSTLIPRHFSELTLTARLHENLSLFTDTLFASDIFFSTPLFPTIRYRSYDNRWWWPLFHPPSLPKGVHK